MTAVAVPPGPSSFEAIAGMATLSGNMRRLPAFLSTVAARHGPVTHWRLGGRRFYLLDDPALLEALFVASARDFVKARGSEKLGRLLGVGLLTSREPLHTRMRRMLQPAFHRSRIEEYAAVMIAAADRAASGWHDGDALVIDREMTRLALVIASETLFGATDVSEEADEIGRALSEAMQTFPASISVFGELLDRIPVLPITRRFNAARARLDATVYRLIARRRAEGSDAGDLLSMLLSARDEAGEPMNDEQIRDEAMTIFVAGHETTANALAWTWFLLAQHPEVEARMHGEIDRVVTGERPLPSDWSQLRYTRDVFAEAMRLYPPVWVTGRRAARDTRLGEWAIPEGSIVLASQYVTHRSPRWFDDPAAFSPDRWATIRERLPKFAYFPFGGGNRICIAESFAWMEGVLAIATIARHWRFRLAGESAVELDPLVTLRPRDPIRVRAIRR